LQIDELSTIAESYGMSQGNPRLELYPPPVVPVPAVLGVVDVPWEAPEPELVAPLEPESAPGPAAGREASVTSM
jgi:hypothetical protein